MKSAAATRLTALIANMGAPAIARRVLVSRSSVENHAAGKGMPRPSAIAAYEEEFGIKPDSWKPAARSRPPPAPAPSPVPPAAIPSSTPATPPDALAIVIQLLATTQRQLEAAQLDEDVPYQARATLITSATRLCQMLARLTGSLEVTQTMICRSAAWTRILRAFETVFARHPEAAAALAEFAIELGEME